MNISKAHEWILAAEHKSALDSENYELCALIKAEVNKRIANNTINHSLMQGFRRFDPATQQFKGPAEFKGLNNLFENYNFDR